MSFVKSTFIPANIYLLKVNNRITRKRCEICSKLTIGTPERRNMSLFFSVSVIDFEHVSVSWGCILVKKLNFNRA